MKYIIAVMYLAGMEIEVPILFPNMVPHDKFKDLDIAAAGFCQIYVAENGEVTYIAFGKSIGLGKESRPWDTDIITNYMGR
jgi:hypothetical protein